MSTPAHPQQSEGGVTIKFDPPTTPDWDSYGAVPTTAAAILVARSIAIVPTVNGGVQIEIHAGGWDVEVEYDEHGQLESVISAAVALTGERS